MNRLKILLAAFVVAVLTLGLYSCAKEETNTENKVINDELTNISQNYSQLVDLSSNVATFKSEEDFSKFMKILPTLSDQQKEELVNQAAFTTFENYLDSLYEQMNMIDDREEFINFINQHSDVFEIIIDDSGDEEVIEKEVSLDPSAIINNKDRIFKVGDTFYKHISDICIKSKDYNILKTIKSKNDAINSRLDYDIAYKILGSDSSLRWTDLNKEFSLIAVNNQSGCNNDRRVKLSWEVFEDDITIKIPRADGGTDKIKNNLVLVTTEIHPTRKGRPCIWFKYKTLITRNNFNFTVDVRVTNSTIATSFNLTRPNTQVEARGLDTGPDLVLSYFPIGNQKTEACWTRERADVTTQGMGGLWINLNQSDPCN